MENIFIDDDIQMQVPKNWNPKHDIQHQIKSEPMDCIEEESTNLNEVTY